MLLNMYVDEFEKTFGQRGWGLSMFNLYGSCHFSL